MKKLLLGLIIGMIINTTNSQVPAKNDLQKMNLKGNIKSVRETSYEAVKNTDAVEKGKRKMESPDTDRDFYIVLNVKGNKTEKTLYNSDNTTFRKAVYQYDDKETMTEEKSYDANGNLITKHNYNFKYDNKGNILEKNLYRADGSTVRKSFYKYSDKGDLNEETLYKEDGSNDGKKTYKYDGKRNIIETILFNQDGSMKWKYTYKYDDKGNCIEENHYKSGTSFFIKYIRKFDDNGNRTEIDWCREDGKPYEKYYSQYDYDKNGNWIRQTQSKEDKPTYIIERELTYY